MDILIADDSAVSRRLLEADLKKWGYRVITASDGTEAWNILSGEEAPRLVILDWMMPGLSGLEVCRRVREQANDHYTYILLLTSRHEKEDLIAGMEAGADDYLVKPFDQNELKVRLGPGRRIIELQRELLAAREELRVQATRDSLTKLWNRRAIFDILAKELARCQRENSVVGIVIGDLDRFKGINDSYGHIAGDAVLAEVADRMLHSIRPYDAVGRYGGEEFLMVLPGCDEDSTLAAAERMRESVQSSHIELLGGSLDVTASFGATSLKKDAYATPETLIRVADCALYRAKQDGRNRCVYLPFE
ncbi:MAG: diguanylate cyclase [Acidimicrobiia bacterium]|nr:diguanylate cyclase [Acidimicrobiia bacterium]